jgi:hypothetical protein
MGARPRQSICLLLNRPRLFQGCAEALVLQRETGAYPFAKRAEGAPVSTPLGSDPSTAASALGTTIPGSLLAIADEVVE